MARRLLWGVHMNMPIVRVAKESIVANPDDSYKNG